MARYATRPADDLWTQVGASAESDASCQVELVLVSICVNVLAVVGLCQVQ